MGKKGKEGNSKQKAPINWLASDPQRAILWPLHAKPATGKPKKEKERPARRFALFPAFYF
jgi:hypothetical protein